MDKQNQHNIDFTLLKKQVDSCAFPVCRGQVTGVNDLCIEGTLPAARIGARVAILTRSGGEIPAEVASFYKDNVKLLPLEQIAGVGPGDTIVTCKLADEVLCGDSLLGRIIDARGLPVDGGPKIDEGDLWAVERPAPDPLKRKSVREQLVTGIRAIDGCLSLGLGQRIGLFAGPGLGKSTLLGTLAGNCECDVCVICLVGERGREVREFIDTQLGEKGLAKSVVVLATADAPPLVRARALNVATAVAEWFRSQSKRVLLLVDSLTRVIRARRDMALALGESPARGGFPASAFSALPSLLERTGCDSKGSISAVYAVLTEGEGDDVVAEETRSLLDGHIVLSKKLAGGGRWPAIDIVGSVSRVMDGVAGSNHLDDAAKLRRLLGAYQENEDLILMGAYRRGTSLDTDLAMDRKKEIENFLRQEKIEFSPLDETLQNLGKITR